MPLGNTPWFAAPVNSPLSPARTRTPTRSSVWVAVSTRAATAARYSWGCPPKPEGFGTNPLQSVTTGVIFLATALSCKWRGGQRKNQVKSTMHSAWRAAAFHAFKVVCCCWVLQGGWGARCHGDPQNMSPHFPLSPPELWDAPVAGAHGERVLPPGRPPPLQVLPRPPQKRVVLLKPSGSASAVPGKAAESGFLSPKWPWSRFCHVEKRRCDAPMWLCARFEHKKPRQWRRT